MRYILIILLFIVFGYSLGLVLANGSEVAVNLLFTQAPAMNLGLLLILCIFLGVITGLILSLLLFKVLQNKWEINRLSKENKRLQEKLATTKIELERQTAATQSTVGTRVDGDTYGTVEEPIGSTTTTTDARIDSK